MERLSGDSVVFWASGNFRPVALIFRSSDLIRPSISAWSGGSALSLPTFTRFSTVSRGDVIFVTDQHNFRLIEYAGDKVRFYRIGVVEGCLLNCDLVARSFFNVPTSERAHTTILGEEMEANLIAKLIVGQVVLAR